MLCCSVHETTAAAVSPVSQAAASRGQIVTASAAWRLELAAGLGLGLERAPQLKLLTPDPRLHLLGERADLQKSVCVCPRVSVGARVCNRDDSVGAQAPTRVRRHSDRTSAMQVRSLMGGSFWCNHRHLTPHRHMHRPPPTAHHRSHTSTGRRVQCLAAQHSTPGRGETGELCYGAGVGR